MSKIASDSSFFICLCCDIQGTHCIDSLLDSCKFVIGLNVRNEVKTAVTGISNFDQRVQTIQYNYSALITPLMGRSSDHSNDGEYDTIGIAYDLAQSGHLERIILDDKRARNFLNKHFSQISQFMTGTIGFICDCSSNGRLPLQESIDLLTMMEDAMKTYGKRPCSMDQAFFSSKVEPIIVELKRRLNVGS